MPASAIDSTIFRSMFATEPMRRVFADDNRIQKYLDIEAALARAEARLGIIPQEAADEICRHCVLDRIDLAALASDTTTVGVPVQPLVNQLVRLSRISIMAGASAQGPDTSQRTVEDQLALATCRPGTGHTFGRDRYQP